AHVVAHVDANDALTAVAPRVLDAHLELHGGEPPGAGLDGVPANHANRGRVARLVVVAVEAEERVSVQRQGADEVHEGELVERMLGAELTLATGAILPAAVVRIELDRLLVLRERMPLLLEEAHAGHAVRIQPGSGAVQ